MKKTVIPFPGRRRTSAPVRSPGFTEVTRSMALASHDSDFLYEDSRSRRDTTSRLGNQYKEVQNERLQEDSQLLGNASINGCARESEEGVAIFLNFSKT